MDQTKVKSLTEGKPFSIIVKFMGPILLGMLFQQMYNMVDAMIVGRILGAEALAAVGGTGAINFMIIGFCMGVCSGFAIPVAQAFGAKKESLLRRYVANSVWLSVIFAVVMTITVSANCRKILELLDTPSDIIEGSYSYIIIIFLGIPTVYLYQLLAGVLRSLGDSKTPLYFLILSSLLNIVLDLLTILVFSMGVAGAAYATVAAQLVSGILCLIYIKKKYPILHIKKEEWKPKKELIGRLCANGVPMGLQYSITAIGSVILQAAVNTLGSGIVAAITAANKINMIVVCPFDAMGATMATYAGQNVGAGKYERVPKGVYACAGLALCYSIVMCGCLFLFGESLVLLFVKETEIDIIRNAAFFLKCVSVFYFSLSLVNILRFSIQGMGYGTLAILSGVFEMIARGFVGFVLVPIYGYIAACIASPLAWIMADIFLIPAHIMIVRHLKKMYQDYEQKAKRI